MEIKELLGHEKGDIITISDLQTIATYEKTEGLDLEIKKVRKYSEADLFTYTGYVASDESGQKFMLMIRQVDDEFDLILFYLDQEGDAEDYYDAVINENGDDFEETFEVEIEGEDVEWIRKSSSIFGVEIEINGTKGKPLTIAEYGTNNDTNNPFAFLEWSSTDEDEWLEIWYGCQIKEHEISILSVK